MTDSIIDYRQAGILRRIPPVGEAPSSAKGGDRYAWPALAQEGLACVSGGGYQRTAAGERALALYDAELPMEDIATLAVVRDHPHRMRGAWAIHRLVGAGLIGLGSRSNGTPHLTPAGEALLAARGSARSRAA